MQDRAKFRHRRAVLEDLPRLKKLMQAAIEELQSAYLDPLQVKASHAIMGLDTQLVEDGTYFVVLAGEEIVGCGGWSRRSTLFGGDHSAGRDAALLDPACDAARVRAMYTDPRWARQGIGRLIMQLCEDAAREEGFLRAELVATLAGEPLYSHCGYTVVRRWDELCPDGTSVPLLLMEKRL